MKDSLGREPRWNADRCAPGDPGAAAPVRHGKYPIASVGVSPPMFFSFVLSVRHCHAEASLANASTGICLLELCMDHRHRRPKDAVLRTTMSGGDESKSGVTVAWHSSGAKARRENGGARPQPPVTLIWRATAGRWWRRSMTKSCPFGLRPIASSIAAKSRSSAPEARSGLRRSPASSWPRHI